MAAGGIFPDRDFKFLWGCYDFVDPYTADLSIFSEDTDIFAFGIVVMMLISKRLSTEEDRESGLDIPCTYMWALEQYNNAKKCSSAFKETFSLMHESLVNDIGFDPNEGHTLTMLARKCVKRTFWECPTMEEVVEQLRKLRVVQENADFIGVDK